MFWCRRILKKEQHKDLFISTTGLSWDNVFDAAFPAITAFFKARDSNTTTTSSRTGWMSMAGSKPPDRARGCI